MHKVVSNSKKKTAASDKAGTRGSQSNDENQGAVLYEDLDQIPAEQVSRWPYHLKYQIHVVGNLHGTGTGIIQSEMIVLFTGSIRVTGDSPKLGHAAEPMGLLIRECPKWLRLQL
jgi:hypothetical protein